MREYLAAEGDDHSREHEGERVVESPRARERPEQLAVVAAAGPEQAPDIELAAAPIVGDLPLWAEGGAVAGSYAYVAAAVLMVIGLYAILTKKNLMKKQKKSFPGNPPRPSSCQNRTTTAGP